MSGSPFRLVSHQIARAVAATARQIVNTSMNPFWNPCEKRVSGIHRLYRDSRRITTEPPSGECSPEGGSCSIPLFDGTAIAWPI